MVSKNRIKRMLIYIFLAIYISIGTVNVYAASGNSPVNNTEDVDVTGGLGVLGDAIDDAGEEIGDGSNEDDGAKAGNTLMNGGTNFVVNDLEEVKEYESKQLGNCNNEGYSEGNISIPALEINHIDFKK